MTHEPDLPPMINTSDGWLLCPKCGGVHTHVDDVFMVGRVKEDGKFVPVRVDATGQVDDLAPFNLDSVNPGRRHLAALAGDCETCGARFTLSFRQHKGSTQVSVRID